jgi:hypothetical protein
MQAVGAGGWERQISQGNEDASCCIDDDDNASPCLLMNAYFMIRLDNNDGWL